MLKGEIWGGLKDVFFDEASLGQQQGCQLDLR